MFITPKAKASESSKKENNKFRSCYYYWKVSLQGMQGFSWIEYFVWNKGLTHSQHQHTSYVQASTFHCRTEATEPLEEGKVSFSLKPEFSLMYSTDRKFNSLDVSCNKILVNVQNCCCAT